MTRAGAPERELVRRTIHEVFAGPAWHGPSVLAALRGMTAATAARRVERGRNTPWELVLHLAYTRHRLLGRLGVNAGRFPRKLRTAWWPIAPAEPTEAAWRGDLALLRTYQERLLQAVGQASEAQLRRRRAGQRRTIADELIGVAVHDAYHAGQIRLIALMKSRRR